MRAWSRARAIWERRTEEWRSSSVFPDFAKNVYFCPKPLKGLTVGFYPVQNFKRDFRPLARCAPHFSVPTATELLG